MPLELTAYTVADSTGWTIEPASPKRAWMDATPGKYAYQCLPLVVANQAGWVIPCPVSVSATWNGKPEPAGTTIRFTEDEARWKPQIASHFGSGIITFSIPWLFRTSPGYGLIVRGPTNYQMDNCVALDGLVETDWAPYTFTMNWRLMRRGTEVWFRKGDPICMIVPFPTSLPEEFETKIRDINEVPTLAEDFTRFKNTRNKELRDLEETGSKSTPRNYIFGRQPDGTKTSEHRTNYKLGKFSR